MRIAYESRNFAKKTMGLIQLADSIIREYQRQGFNLTLRQLYYQLVARGHIANTQRSYKNLGKTISNARRAGLIDWYSIVDRTRNLSSNTSWQSPQEILEAATEGYHRDRWEGQPYRVEVWIEKDALAGVIGGVCGELDVPYFACRGYVSDSAIWRAAQRMKGYFNDGQSPTVIHMGDLDPSGVDMTRDIRDRLIMFAECFVNVHRIALSTEQVDEYEPPPNPAKTTDSRFEAFIAEYGYESWELDALEPDVLIALINDNVEPLIDREIMDAVEALEEEHKEALRKLAAQLPE